MKCTIVRDGAFVTLAKTRPCEDGDIVRRETRFCEPIPERAHVHGRHNGSLSMFYACEKQYYLVQIVKEFEDGEDAGADEKAHLTSDVT